MNNEEIEKNVNAILAQGEVQKLTNIEFSDGIRLAARNQLGIIPVDIDIADMHEDDKDALLSVMRGVRDAVVVRQSSKNAQALNMTSGVPEPSSPYFVRPS